MNRILLTPAALLPVAAAALLACSGIPLKQREAADLARFESYAGAPVDHFTYLGHYDGWKPLSPDQLVIWTTTWEAYLIKVAQPCADLRFSNQVALTTSAASHSIYTRFDFVKTQHWECQIEEIRPVDYRRLKADLRKQGAQAQDATQDAAGN